MSLIYGKYFDGKSSKKNEIQIYFKQKSINFYLLENLNTIDEIVWLIDTIKVENISPNKSLILSYGDFPKQIIQLHGKDNLNLVKEKYPTLFKNNLLSNIFGNNGAKIILTSVILILLFFVFFYKTIFPIITTKIVNAIPIDTEILIGKKMANSFIAQMVETPNSIDKNKTILINNYFNKARFKSNYPIKIYFINENIVNAFAIPGGTIFIYKGILDKMKTSNELAALMAHELAHIQKRHSLISLTKGLTNYFSLSLITSDISGISAVLIDNVMLLKNMSNSRAFEKEADLEALDYLVLNNLPPNGLISLMKSIDEKKDSSKEEFSVENSFAYLSTHPLSSERIQYISAKIKVKKLENTVFPIREDLNAIFNLLKK